MLPHVIDVEGGNGGGCAGLHGDLFTQGVEPKPEEAVEHRQAGDLCEG